MDDKRLVVFNDKKIRRVWYRDDWWFSVVDVVGVLSESSNPRGYLKDMRRRDSELGKGWGQIATPLSIETKGGNQFVNCANKEGILRIIQSIPSKKAEPFKLWLAKVGSERIEEIENPELAQERMKELYEEKGYSKSWIEKRVRGIAIRQDLTDEWKERGVEDNRDFAILTNEIAKATFGIGIKEHKKLKGLELRFKNQNLRDHMDDLELIFSMLGERVATEITQSRNSDGLEECRDSAKEGGEVAGNARKDAESRIGKSVVSRDNYLDIKKKKRIEE
ncbi:phage antirepressor protein [Candidatus Pacearchaeota archaeon]|nr:phage antirepressor protein [Candidatus Pacearchaeota archaeon]